VHHERDVEVGAVCEVDPAADELVAEEVPAVRVAVRTDPEVGPVDIARGSERAHIRRRIDENLATVAAGDVETRLTVDRLAQGAVVLRATPEPRGCRADRNLRNRRDGCELSDLQIRAYKDSAARCDRAVQVLPIDGLEWVAGVRTAAPVRAEPDAAVGAAEDVRRVARVEGERVEVRMLVPA